MIKTMKSGIYKYQEISQIDRNHSKARSRDELILEYAPLVKQIVERMALRLPPHISKEELISGGIIGLFDALDKYDSNKGTQFKTYATLRIKGAILDELRKMDWVSRSVRRDIHRIEDARRTLELKLDREPNDFEIAQELGIDINAYHRMMGRVQGVGLFSLDRTTPEGFVSMLKRQTSNAPSSFDEFQIKELKKIIAKALSQLSEKEQLVMSLYYYDELTLKEIAKVLDLTESRISQIHSKALIKLRIKLRSYYEG